MPLDVVRWDIERGWKNRLLGAVCAAVLVVSAAGVPARADPVTFFFTGIATQADAGRYESHDALSSLEGTLVFTVTSVPEPPGSNRFDVRAPESTHFGC